MLTLSTVEEDNREHDMPRRILYATVSFLPNIANKHGAKSIAKYVFLLLFGI